MTTPRREGGLSFPSAVRDTSSASRPTYAKENKIFGSGSDENLGSPPY